MSIPMDSKIVRLISEDEGVPSIFDDSKIYIIPEYQREYSWDEEQIVPFMSSIKRCLNGEDIFMGTVQFACESKNENEYHVIDGQQRMTTFILFCHLIDLIAGSNITEEYGMNLDIRNFSANADQLARALSIDYDSIAIISGNKKARAEFERRKSRYEKNLSYIKEELEDMLKGCSDRKDAAGNLLETVLSRIYFVEITTKDIPLPQVVNIFNTINTTGLDLNSSDMFKLQYYEYLKRNYPECDDWMRLISGCYEKAKNNGLHMKDFLDIYKHCIAARCYPNFEIVSKSNETFFEEVLSEAKKNSSEKSEKAILLSFGEFERLLDIVIELDKQILNFDSSLSGMVKTDEFLAVDLIWMTRYSRYWTLPYVAAYFNCEKTDEPELRLKKLASALEVSLAAAKYLIVCSVNFDKVINPVQTYVCGTILPGLAKGTSYNAEIKREILSHIKESPYEWSDSENWNSAEFKYRIGNNLFSNGKRTFIVCTLSAFLDEIDEGNSVEEIVSKLFDWDNFKYDIEHIYSRKRFEKEDAVNSSKYNSIGNLVALDASINRSVKDKRVADKVKKYRNSTLSAVKKIISIIDEGSKPEWDLSQVEARICEQTRKLCEYLGL